MKTHIHTCTHMHTCLPLYHKHTITHMQTLHALYYTHITCMIHACMPTCHYACQHASMCASIHAIIHACMSYHESPVMNWTSQQFSAMIIPARLHHATHDLYPRPTFHMVDLSCCIPATPARTQPRHSTGDNGRQRETAGDNGRQRETTGDN